MKHTLKIALLGLAFINSQTTHAASDVYENLSTHIKCGFGIAALSAVIGYQLAKNYHDIPYYTKEQAAEKHIKYQALEEANTAYHDTGIMEPGGYYSFDPKSKQTVAQKTEFNEAETAFNKSPSTKRTDGDFYWETAHSTIGTSALIYGAYCFLRRDAGFLAFAGLTSGALSYVTTSLFGKVRLNKNSYYNVWSPKKKCLVTAGIVGTGIGLAAWKLTR